MGEASDNNLTGDRHIRVFRPAMKEAWKLLPKARDIYDLRSQTLKLRFWPEKSPVDEQGELLDLNWSWIKALAGTHVGELRIDDVIGGFNNLRVIFYDAAAHEHPRMPMIWVLSVLQKKRQDWTDANLTTFDARRKLVVERFYKSGFYQEM